MIWLYQGAPSKWLPYLHKARSPQFNSRGIQHPEIEEIDVDRVRR